MIEPHSDAYFEALGEPKPGQPYGILEQYRFWLAYKHLAPGSVLDVGTYFGDFLKLARRDGRRIYGTEVNQIRVDLANSLLGEDAVIMDFRNGVLSHFDDNSVDNVVATEVVEHLHDVRKAISELCRVARKRVILTVPLREVIMTVLCLHCNSYTPYSGHLHSFDLGSFTDMVPPAWRVIKESPFGNRFARRISALLPDNAKSSNFLRILDAITPGDGYWLLVVLEPRET
jgi:SAM-dependent methyltransferase